MPPPRMDIRVIKDVLRLKLHGGLSHEAIGRSLSISKGVVANYMSLAATGGLDWATAADPAGLGDPGARQMEKRRRSNVCVHGGSCPPKGNYLTKLASSNEFQDSR